MLAGPERRARRRLLVGGSILVAAGVAAATSAGRTEPPSPPQTRSFELAAVGDMTFGRDGAAAPGGARELLAAVSRMLQSDLTVGNLETTLGAGGSAKCLAASTSCFSFQAPTDTATALRHAGFAAVNVANNHSNDYGQAGMSQTNAALSAARLRYTGRPGQTTFVVRNGITIALLGFAPYDYDENLLDVPAAAARVRRAARRADVVVVFIHAGAEGVDRQHVRPGMETYLGERRGDPIRFSHAVVDAGADLVLGSGPHVLRAMEWYRGRLIAYSLGNFTGYRTLAIDGVSGVSAVLRLRLSVDGAVVAGRLVPIRLTGFGTPAPDPERTAIAVVNKLSRSDFPTRGAIIGRLGVLGPARG
jgi:capsule synthesis protein PGA_cap